MLKLGSGNRWDADDKTIYDLRRAQYDDKDITDKKIDMDNVLPQILKSTFLIRDYDSRVTAVMIAIRMWLIRNMLTVKYLLWM